METLALFLCADEHFTKCSGVTVTHSILLNNSIRKVHIYMVIRQILTDLTEWIGIDWQWPNVNSGGSKRAPGARPVSKNSFIFMQFLANILQNNRLAHPSPLEVGVPYGESWISHYLKQ